MEIRYLSISIRGMETQHNNSHIKHKNTELSSHHDKLNSVFFILYVNIWTKVCKRK